VLTHYFLESSAFAKLFVLEQGSQPLIRLLKTVDDKQKYLSSLAAVEVRSAIRRRQRLGQISSSDANHTLTAIEAEVLMIAEIPVNPAVLIAARSILDRHALRTLDALHLATSIMLRDLLQVADVCFVSADDALLSAADAEQFRTLNPLHI
jgi:predicted nucleic acid-binding protein